MSPFGIVHTVISILPIGFGLIAFARDGKIDPKNAMGRLYLLTMLAGSITSWGFIASKGFTTGQVLTLITLALLWGGTFTLRGKWRVAGYVQTLSLSASYLMLLVFMTTEILIRLPVGRPFASGPTDSALIPIRVMLLLGFLLGVSYQLLRMRVVSERVSETGMRGWSA